MIERNPPCGSLKIYQSNFLKTISTKAENQSVGLTGAWEICYNTAKFQEENGQNKV
jgi:hypothetical protein